jgi:enoyl-CoA hydratase/carnithine racemase
MSLLPDGTKQIDTRALRLVAGVQQTENGAIGHLRFNFPKKHNVIDLEGWQAIATVMTELAAIDNMRLIILRGIGGRAFVAGADISQFDEVLNGVEGSDFDRATIGAFDAVADCPIPTLAAIEGYCIGGGLGLAAACDLRLAREDASFGVPAGKLGLAYPANATRQLARAIGPAQAKRILFTAAPISAADAYDIGLVQAVSNGDIFDKMLAEWVAQISANAPMSLQSSKFILDNPQADNEVIKKRLADCLASADYKEGRTAFMEKRKPVFKGQ